MLGAAVLRAAPRGPLHKSQAGQRQAASGGGGEKEANRKGVTGSPGPSPPSRPVLSPALLQLHAEGATLLGPQLPQPHPRSPRKDSSSQG